MATHPFGEDENDIDVKQLLYSHIEVIFLYLLQRQFNILSCTFKICKQILSSFKDAVRLQSIYVDSSPIEKVAMTSINNPSQLWIVSSAFKVCEKYSVLMLILFLLEDHAARREKAGRRKTLSALPIRVQQSEL